MTFVRFTAGESPLEMKGLYSGDKIIRIHGSFFGQFTVTGEEFSPGTVHLLPPLLPQTLCLMGKNSCIKSASSISAGGEVKMKHERLLCTPRLGVVIREKGPSAFGTCLMLDFAPETPGFASSSDGYTLVNAVYKGVEDIACTFNGINLSISAAELIGGMREAADFITLVAGDIVALPLAEPVLCRKGDRLLLAGATELRAVLV